MALRDALGRAAQTLYAPARETFHEARADLFVRLLRPRPGQRMLDLGGSDGSLSARITRRVPLDVTVADPEPTRMAAERYGFSVAAVEPGRPLPFDDDAFDLVLCNSVIEHATTWDGVVGGGRGWAAAAREAQRRFAAEIRRVGKGYFVQTPHADFPVDAHTWLPFTNWLPHGAAQALVGVTDRVWIKRCGVADWRLLRRGDMEALFPDGAVRVERLLGVPKSLVAWKATAAPRP